MAKRCPISTVTQTVIFPKSFGVAKARAWLRAHGEKAGKVDRKTGSLRFRQMPPSKCRKGNYATLPMGSSGIRKVICCPKGR